jgi:hypothetical protein
MKMCSKQYNHSDSDTINPIQEKSLHCFMWLCFTSLIVVSSYICNEAGGWATPYQQYKMEQYLFHVTIFYICVGIFSELNIRNNTAPSAYLNNKYILSLLWQKNMCH